MAVWGSCSTNSTASGSQNLATLPRKKASISSAETSMPGRRTTSSSGRSLQRALGTPMTAASATAGQENGVAIQFFEVGDDLGGVVGDVEPLGRERVAARRPQGLELLPADGVRAIVLM